MRFGSIPVEESAGCILAHSLKIAGRSFKKGLRITKSDISFLLVAQQNTLTVAKLESNDVGEDVAAERIASALMRSTTGLTCTASFAGRVNIHAAVAGIVEVDAEKVFRLNCVDERITLATLTQYQRVIPRSMLATVKIISYAVSETAVENAVAVATGALRLLSPVRKSASLILTQTSGQAEKLVSKGRQAVSSRLKALNIVLSDTQIVRHETDSVRAAINQCTGEIIMILTGSATSDSEDVGPSALRQAGGKLLRFGMPVDPGNLLFLGKLDGNPVIGLPGCARSLALNGADWVLERIACGVTVESLDIAAMGVGGLLKEIPTRPHSRNATANASRRPFVEVAVLATSNSNDDSQRFVEAAIRSSADRVRIISSSTEIPNWFSRSARVSTVTAHGNRGEANLICAALAAIDSSADAVLLLPTDCATLDAGDIDKMIAAFSPVDGREICCISQTETQRALPAVFGRRFFETLANLPDHGSVASIAQSASEFTVEIQQ